MFTRLISSTRYVDVPLVFSEEDYSNVADSSIVF